MASSRVEGRIPWFSSRLGGKFGVILGCDVDLRIPLTQTDGLNCASKASQLVKSRARPVISTLQWWTMLTVCQLAVNCHAHGEGELVITLESWEATRASRRVEEGAVDIDQGSGGAVKARGQPVLWPPRSGEKGRD